MPPTGTESHEILPPIFRPAGGVRNLARDSVCGNTARAQTAGRRRRRKRGRGHPKTPWSGDVLGGASRGPPTYAKQSIVIARGRESSPLSRPRTWSRHVKSSLFLGKIGQFWKDRKDVPLLRAPSLVGAQLVNRPASVYTESMTPSGTNRVKARYLLPCSCGAKIAVEPRQAGQTVHCACGKSLTVPTMLEMAKLERAEAAEDRAQGKNPPAWGVPQILIVLGIVGLLVAGAFAAIAVHLRPPPRIGDLNPETVQRGSSGRWIAGPRSRWCWNTGT